MTTYHKDTPKITDCYFCGQVKLCSITVADYAEQETGYVDEWAICGDCEDAASESITQEWLRVCILERASAA